MYKPSLSSMRSRIPMIDCVSTNPVTEALNSKVSLDLKVLLTFVRQLFLEHTSGVCTVNDL